MRLKKFPSSLNSFVSPSLGFGVGVEEVIAVRGRSLENNSERTQQHNNKATTYQRKESSLSSKRKSTGWISQLVHHPRPHISPLLPWRIEPNKKDGTWSGLSPSFAPKTNFREKKGLKIVSRLKIDSKKRVKESFTKKVIKRFHKSWI